MRFSRLSAVGVVLLGVSLLTMWPETSQERATVFGDNPPAAKAEGRSGEIDFLRLRLDNVFRSEGATAFDVNRDGLVDVVNGEFWYEAPHWTMHEIQKPGEYNGAAGYSHSFACFHWDISGDGWTDLIVIDFPGIPCHWLENPQNKDIHWPKHEIWHSAANESPQFKDVTGDGKPELVMASEPEGMVGYLEIPPPEAAREKWEFRRVSELKIPVGSHRYYHGLGVGDVNNDGRMDIVIPHGYWEQPADAKQVPWAYKPLGLSRDGNGGLPAADIHVDDLDGDGDNDILMSSAHEIGVWWFENVGGNDAPKFKYHVIDETFSQTHALCYADLDGDGTKDLITGKRFFAHGPSGDPDPLGTVVLAWYKITKTAGSPPQFDRRLIPAGLNSGVGTQFMVADVDADGRLDIVLSNKKGTNLLLQRPRAR